MRVEELLEAFICDKDLQKLEKDFGKFNIFDCLKLVRHEIRHSNFLAWLLDPNETHGLNDFFLKEFLKQILITKKNEVREIQKCNPFTFNKFIDTNDSYTTSYSPPSIFEIDYWDMSDVVVYREFENIDLLLVDEVNKFVLVIENKVDISQHDNQLARYREYVDSQYPSIEYKKLFLYLKPNSENVELPYIYISYDIVRNALEKLLSVKSDKISIDISTIIKHYKYIIERDFMNQAELSKICVKLYNKHKEAIDLINRYSNPQKEIYYILKEVLDENAVFWNRKYTESLSMVLCIPEVIKDLDKIRLSNWQENDNIFACLNFVNFRNKNENSLWVEILIAPTIGEQGNNIKELVISHLENNSIKMIRKDKKGWVWSEPRYLLTIREYCDNEKREDLKNIIKKKLYEDYGDFIKEFVYAINSVM